MRNVLKPKMTEFDSYVHKQLTDTIIKNIHIYVKKDGARVADFGCGDMPYKQLFEEIKSEYIGIDIEGSDADITIKPNSSIPLKSKSFTTICSFQVLEHVSDISWYLQEAKRLLTDDGVLLLSTHGVWPYHPHPNDYRRWTKEGLKLDISNENFEILEIHSLIGPPAWTLLFQFGGIAEATKKIPIAGKIISSSILVLMNLILPIADKITPEKLKSENASIYFVIAKKKSQNE